MLEARRRFTICRYQRWRGCRSSRIACRHGRITELVTQQSPDSMPPLVPSTGRDYNPVFTINGWDTTLRMRMV